MGLCRVQKVDELQPNDTQPRKHQEKIIEYKNGAFATRFVLGTPHWQGPWDQEYRCRTGADTGCAQLRQLQRHTCIALHSAV